MLDNEIVSDPNSTVNQSTRLRASVEGYRSFSTQTFASFSSGTEGNELHDSIASSVHDALHTWTVLIYSDARAITTTGLTFSQTDNTIANKLLGIGS